MSPVNSTELPANVKAPAVASNVRPLNFVPAAMLFVVTRLVVPAKTSASVGTGWVFQLAGVFQFPSVPSPVQVSVAAWPVATVRAHVATVVITHDAPATLV